MSTEQESTESPIEAEDNQEIADDKTPLDDSPPDEVVIAELKDELAQAEAKAQDNWDRALRVQAEMENLKKRSQKDLEDTHKFALTGFAKELLPVLDSLELGLQAATGESEEVKKFREGSELTIKQFETVFAKFNVVTVNPMGEAFNAEQHQAVLMQEVEGATPNTVVSVFQKGYMMNGRLLRPAMVVVAKASEKPVSQDKAENPVASGKPQQSQKPSEHKPKA